MSVPSHASHDPPAGRAAIAIGRASVSPCPPYPVTFTPSFTSVTFALGVAATGRVHPPAAFAAGADGLAEAAGGPDADACGATDADGAAPAASAWPLVAPEASAARSEAVAEVSDADPVPGPATK
ncbi:hypothetical protein GCM10010435_33710 [Winogradskya consettensis]|uniref:Uncharacterized protein n=1 Tax=Winogradskya consettensis TaxID=113560 RepID=A0A919SDW8_9ACTN|nr:hypothetical protein Aco04nite_17780 [Actinoplanes consettensis]